jgi:glycogen phosphorylase
VLHIITLYKRVKQNPGLVIPPRAFIFGGKAAPGYFMAKRIIKLINAVGQTVNADPEVNRSLRVVFVPNFNVQNAHLIYRPRTCPSRSPQQARKPREPAT